jgi:hypothetical protein
MAVADMQARLRTYIVGAALIVLGVLVGYLLPQNSVTPKSETGVVMSERGSTSKSAAVFTFKTKGLTPNPLYTIEDPIQWQRKKNGPWSDRGLPSCLTQGSKVTIGVISVRPVSSEPANSSSMVVWVECYT